MKRILIASLLAGVVLVGCSAPADTTEPTENEQTSSTQTESGAVASGGEAGSWKSTVMKLGNAEVGQEAPSFEVADEKGEKWTLSDYQGKVVVLDFWAFW